jgi:hypothetical protein
MILFPDTSSSTLALEQAVSGTSAAFGAMAVNEIWRLTATTNLWWSQGATPTATAGAGSAYLAAGQVVLVNGNNGAQVAVIEDTAAGKASLCRCSTRF